MGTSAAIRQRQYRQRLRDGKITLSVTVPEIELAEALVATGFLSPQQQDDRAALTEALERVISVWTTGVTRNAVD